MIGVVATVVFAADLIDQLPQLLPVIGLPLLGYVVSKTDQYIKHVRKRRKEAKGEQAHKNLLWIQAMGVMLNYFNAHLGDGRERRKGFRVGGFLQEFESACPQGIKRRDNTTYYDGFMLEDWIQENAIAQMFKYGPVRDGEKGHKPSGD